MRKLFIGLCVLLVIITLWNAIHPVVNSNDYYVQLVKRRRQQEVGGCSMCNSNRRYTL